jgi:hypothetical protein
MANLRERRRRFAFRRVTLDAIRIDEERTMRRVPLYARLKSVLVKDGYEVRVGNDVDWNRAILLNLSFWSADDTADVVVDGRIPADVVAHMAWHHVAKKALGKSGSTVDGRLLGESIASAFDAYLIGKLLTDAPGSDFVRTQVEAMSEVARLSQKQFGRLLERLAIDPARAFAELRTLLFEVSTSLVRARGVDDAAKRLDAFHAHPLFPILHHYNLSNWLLHSRAYGPRVPPSVDARIAKIHRALSSDDALDWLAREWLD